jgi:hypothetical protein
MTNDDYIKMMEAFGGEFMALTDQVIARKLADHGLSSLTDAPPDLASRIYREASFEVASRNPEADLDTLDRVLTGMARADLRESLKRIRALVAQPYDAFAPATGKDAAIAMAFFGLPVAPMDRRSLAMMAQPSADLDTVSAMFDRAKTAFVGYSTCEANFYTLVTDCADTLARMMGTNEQVERVANLFRRDKTPLPQPRGVPFVKACAAFRRYSGEEIGSFIYSDPRPDWGSMIFSAGWMDDGEAKGTAAGGFRFVPLQLVEAFMQMPDAHSFVRGDSKPAPASMH